MAAEPRRASDQALPKRVGRYDAFLQIGAGGMARVYLAMQRDASGQPQLVVVKILRPEAIEDEHVLALFMDEARIAMRLKHPNVIRTREVVAEPPDYLLAMDFQNGQSLLHVLRRLGRQAVPIDEHIHVLSKVLAGLSHAHELKDDNGQPFGIVHRDVSPANVLVSYTGEVKLLDFGIAKATGALAATQDGVVKGKLGYAAPEQCLGKPADPRSDVYAVGVMLWEAVAGRRRASGETWHSVLQARLDDAEPQLEDVCPDAPRPLAAITRKALARDPAERYATAREFQNDLEKYLGTRGPKIGPARIAAMLKPHFDQDRADQQRAIEAFLSGQQSSGSGQRRRVPLPGKAAHAPSGAPPAAAPARPIVEEEQTSRIPVDAALLILSRHEAAARDGNSSPPTSPPSQASIPTSPPPPGSASPSQASIPTSPPPPASTPAPLPRSALATAPPPNTVKTPATAHTAPATTPSAAKTPAPLPRSATATAPSSATKLPAPFPAAALAPPAVAPAPPVMASVPPAVSSAPPAVTMSAPPGTSASSRPKSFPAERPSQSIVTSDAAYGLVTVSTPVPGRRSSLVIASPSAPKKRARVWAAVIVTIGAIGLTAFAGITLRKASRLHAATAATVPAAEESTAATPQPQAPKVDTVKVRISVDPPDAIVKLDGRLLSSNPFVAIVPKDNALHELTAFADGCRDTRQVVHLNQDVDLLVAMKRLKGFVRSTAPRSAPAPAPLRVPAAAAVAAAAVPPTAAAAPAPAAPASSQPVAESHPAAPAMEPGVDLQGIPSEPPPKRTADENNPYAQ